MDVSIISPFNNEEGTIKELVERLLEVIKTEKIEGEIILVNDGSTDDSLEVLKKISKKNREGTKIKIISHSEKKGKTAAIYAGLKAASKPIIAIIDADLQFLPEDLPQMLRILKEEKEISFVNGCRKNRKDRFFKILFSKIYNFLTNKLLGPTLKDHNTGIKVFYKQAIPVEFLEIKGAHRFLPSIAFNLNYNVKEVPVKYTKRIYGKSKYHLSRIVIGLVSLKLKKEQKGKEKKKNLNFELDLVFYKLTMFTKCC